MTSPPGRRGNDLPTARPALVGVGPLGLSFGKPSWFAAAATAVLLVMAATRLASRLTTVRSLHPPSNARRRPMPLTDAELVVFLDAAAGAVRAGSSSSTALDEASAGDVRLQTLLRAARPATPGQQLVCQAVRMARETGGQVGAIFDSAAAVLRERQAIHAEARSHSAQARLSAAILTWLPIGFTAVIALGQRGRTSLSSPAGLTCVLIGISLNALGWLWMRRLIRTAQR